MLFCFFFFKQKTAYEMRISDWSSDVCSSDLDAVVGGAELAGQKRLVVVGVEPRQRARHEVLVEFLHILERLDGLRRVEHDLGVVVDHLAAEAPENGVRQAVAVADRVAERHAHGVTVGFQLLGAVEHRLLVGREGRENGLLEPGLALRSEEHTSEHKSLMRSPYD